jgi:hypothetical protein
MYSSSICLISGDMVLTSCFLCFAFKGLSSNSSSSNSCEASKLAFLGCALKVIKSVKYCGKAKGMILRQERNVVGVICSPEHPSLSEQTKGDAVRQHTLHPLACTPGASRNLDRGTMKGIRKSQKRKKQDPTHPFNGPNTRPAASALSIFRKPQ